MQKGSANLCSCVHWFLTKFYQFSLPLFAQVESRLESLARVVQKSNATTASSSMQGSPFFRSWNCGRFHFEFVLGMGTAEGSGVALATDALSVTPVKMPLSAIAVSVATVILAETDVSPSTDVSLLWENGHTHRSRLSPTHHLTKIMSMIPNLWRRLCCPLLLRPWHILQSNLLCRRTHPRAWIIIFAASRDMKQLNLESSLRR